MDYKTSVVDVSDRNPRSRIPICRQKYRRAGKPTLRLGEGEGEASNKTCCKWLPIRLRLACEVRKRQAAKPSDFSSIVFGWAPTAAAAGSPSLNRIIVGIDMRETLAVSVEPTGEELRFEKA